MKEKIERQSFELFLPPSALLFGGTDKTALPRAAYNHQSL